MTVKDMWARVQEMFAPRIQTDFERWLQGQYYVSVFDLERLQLEYWNRRFTRSY